jgi:predicted TPR repeat methyltransferase
MSSKLKIRKKGWKRRPHGEAEDASIRLAIKKHQEGQIEEATAIYKKILAQSPDHVDALHFLGVAEHQLGNSEKAQEYINRALELMPDHPDARNNRGNILKKLGRLDEAEADYRRALELRPTDPNTLSNLGTILRARGDLEGAEATFRKVLAYKPDHAPAWQNLGNTLRGLGRLNEALDAHREAMRLAPQSADSYRLLGALLNAVDRTDEAKEVYHRWLALFPNDPRAQHFGAASTGESIPARASDDCIRAEFDEFAHVFDTTLARLEYRAPGLVNEEVTRIYGAPEQRLAVLDAGCGTGLCGPLLRPRASFLAGVDLSSAMVDLARKRAVYDALVVAELSAYLRQHERTSDLIVSADTLVYFGDLSEVTQAAAKSLRPGGAFVFTVERVAEADAPTGFRLNLHGRYSHTNSYLLRVLGNAGFAEPAIREVNLRKEAEQWVSGWLVSARVPAVTEAKS